MAQSASVRIRHEQAEVIQLVARCRLQSLHEALDHHPGGRLEFHAFAVLAGIHLRTHRL
jgi:hypothetical protein